MFYWIIYDISNDKSRLRVFRKCRQYGLVRVQRSVFTGKIQPKLLTQLEEEILEFIEDETDRLLVFQMPSDSFDAIRTYGQPIRLRQIARPEKAVFI